MALRAIALTCIIAMIASGPAIAGADDEGFITRVLQSYLSDAGREVRIRGFDGALSSRATMEEMTIADDLGVWLILRGAVLDWNRAALFDRRVEINDLSAREIEILRLPQQSDNALPQPTARVGLPQLPVAVEIGRIDAGVVTLHTDVAGQEARLTLQGRLNLRGRMGDVALLAQRIDDQPGTFRINAELDEARGYLDLQALFDEGAGGIAATLLGIPDQPALNLSISGAGPVRGFRAEVDLSVNQTRQLSGFVALPETPSADVPDDSMALHVDLAGDLRPIVAPDLRDFFGNQSRLRSLIYRTPQGEILLQDLTLSTASVTVTGRADLRADGLPRLVHVTGNIRDPQGRPVILPGSGGETRLGAATIDLDFDARQSERWTVDISVTDLSAPEIEIATLALQGSGELRLDGSGPLMDGSFDLQALGIGSGNPALERALGRDLSGFASLFWDQRDQPLDLTGFVLESNTVSLSGAGRLTNGTFDGFVETEVRDLSDFSGLADRDLSGTLLATAEGDFGIVTGAFDLGLSLRGQDVAVGQPELDRLLAGSSIMRGRLSRTREGTDLNDFHLNSGTLTLTGQGKARPRDSVLELALDMRDLSVLGPDFGGTAQLVARYETLDRRENLRLQGTTRDLRLGETGGEILEGLLAGETRLNADVSRHRQRTSVQVLELDNARLALSARGVIDPRGDELTLDLSRLGLDALLPGMAGNLAGQAQIGGTSGSRTMALSLAGTVVTGVPELDQGLRGGQIELAANLREDRGGFALSDARLTGAGVTGQARGRVGGAVPSDLHLSLEISDLAPFVLGVRGPAALRGRVHSSTANEDLQVDVNVEGPAALAATVRGRVGAGFMMDLTVSGQVDAAIANPSVEPVLVQGVVTFQGYLRGAARLENLRATAQTRNARVISPRDGVAFQNITASANLNGLLAQVEVRGDAERGGSASLSGTIRLDRRRDADLIVHAQNLTILQPRLFSTTLSGSARLTGPLALGARISGRIDVNEAEIRIPASTLARVPSVPVGLRHVNETAASRVTRRAAQISTGTTSGRRPPPLYLDLQLQSQGRIFVRGRGLDAELGGTLHLGGSTHDVIPGGAFDLIRGRLDFLGHRFTLSEGLASMVGSFVPFVYLSATTESDGVLTTVIVEGEADQPQIRFDSAPELPDDEILARLVFRRSLSSLTPFQAAQLGLSLATLTGLTDEGILDRTRNRLGLHDLDLQTNDAGEVELRAGRYINERVYTDVGVDTQGRGRVSVQIDLSPSVTLRGRTDSAGRSGVGVFFERDY